MKAYLNSRFFRLSALVLIGMPLLIWAAGDFPERTFLKDALSVITILAFFQMIGQFFWTRTNRAAASDLKKSKVIKYHKFIGYTFVAILIFHPFYVVVPRFFEAGVSPFDAFATILTTFNQGIVLGMAAWCLMLVLGITSLIRKKLPMKYKTWRIYHGILSMLFILVAAGHVIDVGRHSNLVMAILISLLSAGGVWLLLRTYTIKKSKKVVEA